MMRDHMMGFPPAALCETDEETGVDPFFAWLSEKWPFGEPNRVIEEYRRERCAEMAPFMEAREFEKGDHGAKLGITEGACKTGEASRACIGSLAPADAYAAAVGVTVGSGVLGDYAANKRFFDHWEKYLDAAEQVAQSEQPAPLYSDLVGTSDDHRTDAFAYCAMAARARAQFEAAEKPQEQWFEHKGGECPVAPGTWVRVKFRNGSEDGGSTMAGAWFWSFNDCDYDIVAWRYA